MAPFDSGRRLCLLFSAGAVRYAIDATAVVEVATPDSAGESIRGFHELKDLSSLLGGPPEVRPGMGVVLDVSPTLALRVGEIHEVADVAGAELFRLPQELAAGLGTVVRGALRHQTHLYLELVSDALMEAPPQVRPPPSRPPLLLETAPDQALVFESGGKLFGVALGNVLQVVSTSPAFSALPWQEGALVGLFPHVQGLWPIYSASAMAGRERREEPLFVLSEVAGQQVGLCASRVLGVQQGFARTEQPGEFESARTNTRAMFLDLQRMFS